MGLADRDRAMNRLRDDTAVVAVELALILTALTPAIILGTDLLIRSVQYAEAYVTCQAQLVPGDPWPTACNRFLAEGVEPPEVVPGLPLPTEPSPSPSPTPEATP